MVISSKENLSILLICSYDKCILKVKKLFKELYDIDNIVISKSMDEAIALYKAGSYDLVVTSFLMSDVNGLKLIKKMRKINEEQIFVMISRLDNKKDMKKAIKLHVRYFIEYPIKKAEFKTIFNSCIKRVNNKYEITHISTILQQYKIAVDTTTILSKTDETGKITYVNDQFCKISKYSLPELIGNQHNILRHEEMPRETFYEMWNTIQNEKNVWKGIIKNKAKDGSTYIVDATIIPILDQDGNILEYLGIRHDVTEIESYKELLKDKLDTTSKGLDEKVHLIKEFEKAIDVSASFTRTDTLGIITYVNEKFCETSGYEKEVLLGNTFNLVRAADVSSKLYEKMWKDLKNKKIWRGILKNVNKAGEKYYMDTTIIPIVDVNDQIIEYISIKHDVSEIIYLNKEVINTQKEIVYTMGAICEGRSKETSNHVQRVAQYSYIMAKKYGIDRKECELIKLASPVHDIGKIAIPDGILKKPGKLTNDEYDLMKTHSAIGYDMLKNSKRDILKTAATIAHEHHEKWNGTGYPRGLKGENIHIYGRITAICDVFDALGSDRYYKKAWPLDKILSFFKNEKGEHFDPNLVDIFFDNLDEFLSIRDKYID